MLRRVVAVEPVSMAVADYDDGTSAARQGKSDIWVINVEIAPSIRFADYSNIPSEMTDNFSLTVGLGLQYRF